MAIFEKNKGTALIPKAAFGMSASIKQIGEKKPEPAKPDLQKPKIQRYNDPGTCHIKCNSLLYS